MVVYLIPRTAVLGAILMTGLLGGATITTLRVGDPKGAHPAGHVGPAANSTKQSAALPTQNLQPRLLIRIPSRLVRDFGRVAGIAQIAFGITDAAHMRFAEPVMVMRGPHRGGSRVLASPVTAPVTST